MRRLKTYSHRQTKPIDPLNEKSSLSEQEANVKHGTIRKCPACGAEVGTVQKNGELFGGRKKRR